jgi:preprotein translocase subunit SecB
LALNVKILQQFLRGKIFMTNATNVKETKNNPEFAIQRIYLRDLSFEMPNVPEVFRTEWTPEVNMDLNTSWNKLEEDVYEAVLRATVSVKLKEKVAFLIEAQYAGIFTIKHFSKDQMGSMLGSYCPTVLFPYVREVISETISRASMPPLYLAPINFDALYQQQMAKEKEKEKEKKE